MKENRKGKRTRQDAETRKGDVDTGPGQTDESTKKRRVKAYGRTLREEKKEKQKRTNETTTGREKEQEGTKKGKTRDRVGAKQRAFFAPYLLLVVGKDR